MAVYGAELPRARNPGDGSMMGWNSKTTQVLGVALEGYMIYTRHVYPPVVQGWTQVNTSSNTRHISYSDKTSVQLSSFNTSQSRRSRRFFLLFSFTHAGAMVLVAFFLIILGRIQSQMTGSTGTTGLTSRSVRLRRVLERLSLEGGGGSEPNTRVRRMHR